MRFVCGRRWISCWISWMICWFGKQSVLFTHWVLKTTHIHLCQSSYDYQRISKWRWTMNVFRKSMTGKQTCTTYLSHASQCSSLDDLGFWCCYWMEKDVCRNVGNWKKGRNNVDTVALQLHSRPRPQHLNGGSGLDALESWKDEFLIMMVKWRDCSWTHPAKFGPHNIAKVSKMDKDGRCSAQMHPTPISILVHAQKGMEEWHPTQSFFLLTMVGTAAHHARSAPSRMKRHAWCAPAKRRASYPRPKQRRRGFPGNVHWSGLQFKEGFGLLGEFVQWVSWRWSCLFGGLRINATGE